MEVMCLKLKRLVRHDRSVLGPTHTELSVTLSYLPKRINNNRTTVKEMCYFFRTLRNPE